MVPLKQNANPTMRHVGMEHPDRKEAGPNLNDSSAELMLGSHGKPLVTIADRKTGYTRNSKSMCLCWRRK